MTGQGGATKAAPSAEQARAILDRLPDSLALPVALIACGLRVGEVLALQRGDVLDAEDGMWLAVQRIRLTSGRTGDSTVGPLKGGEPFDVPVAAALAERMRDHLAQLGGESEAPLFSRSSGGPWDSAGLIRAYHAALAGTDYANTPLHLLRHAAFAQDRRGSS